MVKNLILQYAVTHTFLQFINIRINMLIIICLRRHLCT